jgi:hypothetical protein
VAHRATILRDLKFGAHSKQICQKIKLVVKSKSSQVKSNHQNLTNRDLNQSTILIYPSLHGALGYQLNANFFTPIILIGELRHFQLDYVFDKPSVCCFCGKLCDISLTEKAG